MTHLQKLTTTSVAKWVSFNFYKNQLKSSWPPLLGSFCFIDGNPRFYGSVSALQSENFLNLDEGSRADSVTVGRVSRLTRSQAQGALLEYLHSTRCIPFVHAEHMSRNSPHFLENLLKKIEIGQKNGDVARLITRFLRYHPINEFELFFESVGLKPSEFAPVLPRNLMFLTDKFMLLENYNVLCSYGIPRDKIGQMYMQATAIFGYDDGVLQSELQAFENLGLQRPFIFKAITCSPSILIADVHSGFIKVFNEVKTLGIDYSWIEGHLLDGNSYNLTQILNLVCLFCKIGCNEKQLEVVFSHHPDLFEDSGNRTLSLIGFLLKLGFTRDEILAVFMQFPQIRIGKFLQNMRQCYLFLVNINMENEEIGRIVRSRPVLVGSCSLKKTNSLLSTLNTGKKRLCGIVKENPEVLKSWVLGSRVKPLPNTVKGLASHEQRTKFLLELGFERNSNAMKKALKLCRGKGEELQERFDCFVKAGLDRKDVLGMIKRAPQVLNQSKDMIELKIDVILNELGYPASSLVEFPAYICLTIKRVKLRLTMYEWLKKQGVAEPNLALSTILSSADKYFVSQYVNRHSRGPKLWEVLHKKIYSK